jgi:hypothetical protein
VGDAVDEYRNWLQHHHNLLRNLKRVKTAAGPYFDNLVADVNRTPVTTTFGPIHQPLHAKWNYPLIIPEIISMARAGAKRCEIVDNLYIKYEMPDRTAERMITASSKYNP